MNERIRELAEQATKYAFEWAEGDSKINPKITPDKWLKAYQEKFAELIVRECAQFCEDKNSKLLGTMLKEHFGVEE